MCLRISLEVLFEILLSIKEVCEILSQTHLGLHVKYTSLSSGLMQTSIFSVDSQKNAQNIKFHEYPSSVSQAGPCGTCEAVGRTCEAVGRTCEAVGRTCARADWRTDRQTDRNDEAKSRFSQFC